MVTIQWPVDETQEETNARRAQHFIDSAQRLEIQAARLMAEAKGFRDLAAKLNPTSSSR